MKKILVIGGLAIATSLVWAYWYTNQEALPLSETLEEENVLIVNKPATTTPAVTMTDPKVYKGQALSFLAGLEALSKYPTEFVEAYKDRLSNAIAMIKESPNDSVYWIEIGLVKKTFDNYIGARDAWNYATVLDPKNSVIYHNLGNLYALYLKDVTKAEKNYKLSLALDPMSAQPYLTLADFYKDFYPGKANLAEGVLLEGLNMLPNDGNLILNLALYYKSTGNKWEAIEYFEKFLALPDLTGTQQAAVKTEIEALKSPVAL